MADQDQLTLLRGGADQWNLWKWQYPEVECDFKEADLTKADLSNCFLRRSNFSGADLTKADLTKARLVGANLHEARLYGAILEGANLCEANLCEAVLQEAHLKEAQLQKAHLRRAQLPQADLRGARLSEADLRKADLSEADLSGANLMEADLRGAFLRGADLTEAIVGWTNLSNIDLREVKGLETIDHFGPSSIDIVTFYRWEGQIPESFLRQAGVPEGFLTYLPALMNRAIEYYTCFISYASQNEDFAQRLYADLQAKGVRCWFAPEDMKIGDKIRQRIDESIRLYDKLLLVLSEQSVASPWVEFEVEAALEKERRESRTVLFPISLDEQVMLSHTAWAADIRRSRHIGDFTRWKEHDSYQQGLHRLLRDLQPDRPSQSNTSLY